MKFIKTLVTLALLGTTASFTPGHAQSLDTASQQLQLSAFGAATGTFTRLEGGKNAAITAGIDLTYLPLRYFRPSIEVRGTWPVYDGTISSQKSILAGVKVEHAFGRLHPYADFLLGRGEIDYGCRCFLTPDETGIFISTTTNVYSPGGGFDYKLARSLAFKADVQYQFWSTPVTYSGSIHPVAVSFGGVYYFNFNRSYRHNPGRPE
jgi:hypothetical protein